MSITDQHPDNRPAVPHDPLPVPGESLSREIERIEADRLGPFVALVAASLAFLLLEWWRLAFALPITLKSAVFTTCVTLVIWIVAFHQLFRIRRTFRHLAKGIRAERHVGHYLNDICRGLNYRVLHDIPATDFNVDHVLIGPGGIFVIETKNWTLPPKGTKAALSFDGNTLTKPNGSFDTHAPAQAMANADFIRKLLAKRTARDPHSIRTFPVLIFPGWWIDETSPKPNRHIWVFGDDTLHKWLPNEPRRLPASDVALFTETLSEYTRNFKK
jgi:hypothetical protein